MVGLEECCGAFDGLISSAQKLCVRCRNVDKIIGRSILYIMTDLLQLGVHFFMFIGDRSSNIGK